jgi:hypothetical protein
MNGACILRRMKGRVVYSSIVEVHNVIGIVPRRSKVRCQIRGVRADGNRGCKRNLLPARRALRSRIGTRQVDTVAGRGPQVRYMLTGVRRRLIKADAEDVPVKVS